MWSSRRSQPNSWTATIDIHLFVLISKLLPVLHAAKIAAVIFEEVPQGEKSSITFPAIIKPPHPTPPKNLKVDSLFLVQCVVMNAPPLCVTVNAPHLWSLQRIPQGFYSLSPAMWHKMQAAMCQDGLPFVIQKGYTSVLTGRSPPRYLVTLMNRTAVTLL